MDREQDVCLFSRKRMELTGICEVEGFTENEMILSSDLGMISLEGRDMKIVSFSTESGVIKITGEFSGFYYYTKSQKSEKNGIFSRLFK